MGPDGRCAELEAVVDTDATFTKIPESVASELGLQIEYEAEVELGDKRVVRRGKIHNRLHSIRTARFQGKPPSPGSLKKTFAIEY